MIAVLCLLIWVGLVGGLFCGRPTVPVGYGTHRFPDRECFLDGVRYLWHSISGLVREGSAGVSSEVPTGEGRGRKCQCDGGTRVVD